MRILHYIDNIFSKNIDNKENTVLIGRDIFGINWIILVDNEIRVYKLFSPEIFIYNRIKKYRNNP